MNLEPRTSNPECRLIPCIPHDAREPPASLSDAEALGVWAAVSGPWHPALLSRVEGLPRIEPVDFPLPPTAGDVRILAAGTADRLPSGSRTAAADCGAVILDGEADRLALVRQALAHIDPNAPLGDAADPIVLDFLALGTARWLLRDLSVAMGHAEGLDVESLTREGMAGARAWRDGDRTAATNRLRAAFELLTQARERFYPVDAYILDLVLLDPASPLDGIGELLAARVPFSFLATARAIATLAGRDPERVAALREAITEGWADVVGGTFDEVDEPLLPVESIVWQFRHGGEVYRHHLDDRNVETLAQRRFALYPQRPQLARRFGLRFGVHWCLDAGRFPTPPEAKRLWDAPDGSYLESLMRPPLAADRASSGLHLPWRLARAMRDDHVATLPLVHWPSPVAAWYLDLRRVASYSPVLARWMTLGDYFHRTDRPFEMYRTELDQYVTPYLSQAVARGDTAPISRRSEHARLRSRLEALGWIGAVARALATGRPGAAEPASGQEPASPNPPPPDPPSRDDPLLPPLPQGAGQGEGTGIFPPLPVGEGRGEGLPSSRSSKLDLQVPQDPHPGPLPQGEGVEGLLEARSSKLDLQISQDPHPGPLPEGEGVLDLTHLEEALETGRLDEARTALDRLEPARAESLAREILGPATGARPGYLVLNPLGVARRAAVLLPDAAADLRPEGPLRAAQFTEEGVWAVVDLPAFGFAWVPRDSSPDRPLTLSTALGVRGQTLRNEVIEVELDQATGGLRSVRAAGEPTARLGQQLVMTGLLGPDGQSVPSRMKAEAVEVEYGGPALAQAVARGVVLGPDPGRPLARFHQRVRVWSGRPAVELEITLDDLDADWLARAAEADPWSHFVSCRWAWPDPSTMLRRLSLLGPVLTETDRPETPDALDLSTRRQRTALLFGGLAHHRRHGPRMLDTLLVAGRERGRHFRLGVVLDLEHPFHAALDLTAPPLVVPVASAPVAATGWFFQVEPRSIAVTRVEPAANDQGAGLAFHLLETSGRAARGRLRLCRNPSWARQVDFNGDLIVDLSTDGDAVPIDLTPHELARVEVTI